MCDLSIQIEQEITFCWLKRNYCGVAPHPPSKRSGLYYNMWSSFIKFHLFSLRSMLVDSFCTLKFSYVFKINLFYRTQRIFILFRNGIFPLSPSLMIPIAVGMHIDMHMYNSLTKTWEILKYTFWPISARGAADSPVISRQTFDHWVIALTGPGYIKTRIK